MQEVKYLGVLLNPSMKTSIDVSRQTRKFYAQAIMLLHNFRYCSNEVKCSLFKSFCTNMYCCPLWFNSTSSSKTLVNFSKTIKLSNTKGHDGISSDLLKLIGNAISKSITLIINQSLTTGIFPDRLKIAKVIPIFKKDRS